MPSTSLTYLVAMLGSALGGGARLWISTRVAQRLGLDFPWGTLAVNVVGCLAVGALGALMAPTGPWHGVGELRVFLIVGLLGGFTTFSAFSLEAVLLVQRGQWTAAGAYAVTTLLLCVLAAALSFAIMQNALR
jgi:fluoride exporter